MSSPSPSPNEEDTKDKKLDFQTFLDLTRENQIKVVAYLIGALVLLMVGISGLSGGMNAGSIILGVLGLACGGWLGYTGYTILIDSKNAKKCNALFWSVTEKIGFDKDDYKSDLGITLCKAQIKAEYDGYAGFYCVANTESENTIDAYYINLTDSKKLTLKSSGTSNVFTIKSGENKITVTEPPGSFTLAFGTVSYDSVIIRGSLFDRVDDTKNAIIVVTQPNSSPSSPVTSSATIQNLKDGITLTGPFESGTVFSVTVYSTTQNGIAVTKSIRLNLVTSPSPVVVNIVGKKFTLSDSTGNYVYNFLDSNNVKFCFMGPASSSADFTETVTYSLNTATNFVNINHVSGNVNSYRGPYIYSNSNDTLTTPSGITPITFTSISTLPAFCPP